MAAHIKGNSHKKNLYNGQVLFIRSQVSSEQPYEFQSNKRRTACEWNTNEASGLLNADWSVWMSMDEYHWSWTADRGNIHWMNGVRVIYRSQTRLIRASGMQCNWTNWLNTQYHNIIAAKDSVLKISACIDYDSDSFCAPAVFHRIISQNEHRICQKRSLYSPKNLFAGEEGAVLRWRKKDNHFSHNV